MDGAYIHIYLLCLFIYLQVIMKDFIQHFAIFFKKYIRETIRWGD